MQTLEYLNYDEEVDHLTIYKSDEDIDTNIDNGLVILSLNKKRDIIGVEFMGAFRNFNIPLKILENLESCKVLVKYIPQNQMIIINVYLKSHNKESPIIFSSHTDLGDDAFVTEFECSSAA
ncbi:DUF2283 domain-containing protein [Candidatus Woesearchaeota archaeon]|nr:DUF2283 domain-containing protein [Candidatus Woesearchaeota archaeon]